MDQNYQNTLIELHHLIDSSKKVLVLTHQKPTLDSLASSLVFYLSLPPLGKEVTVACPDLPTVELSNLVGVNKIGNSLGGKNLIISFPYIDGSIEKVSYNIDKDKFNLVIEPRGESLAFQEEAVQFTYGGGNTDLIFVIDTPNLSDLGSLNQQDVFSGKPVVNIDCHNGNTNFGKINIVDPNTSGTAEIVTLLFHDLKINLDPDGATNLFSAISQTSNNFSSERTLANTFEAASICLQSGAKREIQKFQPVVPSPQSQSVIQRQPQPQPTVPTPQLRSPQSTSPIGGGQRQTPAETPPEWLKPKIYKSSTLL